MDNAIIEPQGRSRAPVRKKTTQAEVSAKTEQAIGMTLTWNDGKIVIGEDWNADDFARADRQLRHLQEKVIPLERGRLMCVFQSRFEASADEIAAHFGCTRQTVYNYTSLARRVGELPDGLSEGHARAVSALPKATQQKLLNRAVEEGMTPSQLGVAVVAEQKGISEEDAEVVDIVSRMLDLARRLPTNLPALVESQVNNVLAELAPRLPGVSDQERASKTLHRMRLFSSRLPVAISGDAADDARALALSLTKRVR